MRRASKRWGWVTAALLALAAWGWLLRSRNWEHYRLFALAGKALWGGGNPYGVNLGSPVGLWFYSPACGMFVFGPLGALPERLGLSLYILGSVGLLAAGMRAWGKQALGFGPGSRAMQLGCIAITPQLVGSILAAKLEIAMTGILLLAASALLPVEAAASRGRRTTGAAAAIGLILNWKFQPLPSAGLLALVWLARGRWRYPVAAAGFVALAFLLPALFLPWEGFVGMHRSWSSSLDGMVRGAWSGFDNFHAFLFNTFGLRYPYGTGQALSLAAGTACASLVWALARRESREREAGAAALGLGAAFAAVFSPLSQNNAGVILAPLYLWAIGTVEPAGRWKGAWGGFLAAAWLLVALGYSDLMPEAVRVVLRSSAAKPAACLALAAAVAVRSFYAKRPGEGLFV